MLAYNAAESIRIQGGDVHAFGKAADIAQDPAGVLGGISLQPSQLGFLLAGVHAAIYMFGLADDATCFVDLLFGLIGLHHGLQARFLAAVAAVAVGVIAVDEIGVARAQQAAIGIGREAQHTQRAALLWGKAVAMLAIRLHLGGAGSGTAGYRLQRIGIIAPARGLVDPGSRAEGAILALPASHGVLGGQDLVAVHPGEIIIASVEGADVIEAEPAIIARPIEAGGADAGRAKLALLRAAGPIAGPRGAAHPAMESIV